MGEVMDELSRWDKPALVMFSDSDPVFPYPRAGQVFCDLIPGAGEQVRVEGAAHFLQEDRGEQIGERLAAFVAG
jgi:haloalkane dehalogenase